MVTLPCILYFGYHPDAPMLRAKLAGMQRYAAARGWMVETASRHKSTPENLPALLESHRPIGCIVECHYGGSALVTRLFGDVPVVYVTLGPGHFGPGVRRVEPDDAEIARAAMRELAANNPKAYAYVGLGRPAYWSDARGEAFGDLARATGLPFREFRRYRANYFDNNDEGRTAALREWMAALPQGCAIMAANDAVAAETLAAGRAARRSCPYDFTLVGVDNSEFISGADDISISTIRVDYERMGYVAANMIGDCYGTAGTGDAESGGCPIRLIRHSCPIEPMPPALIGPLLVLRRKSTRGSGRRAPFVIEAVEIIRREACDGLEPGDLIARFPCSRRLFETRFREAMGHSILEEIRQVRLERVCSLLAETDMPVSAISDFCGFGSGHALRELFRDRLGMSMRTFRANRGH